MRKIIPFILLMVISVHAWGDEIKGRWSVYTYSNDLRSVIENNGSLWCGTRGGIVKWNLSNMSYIKYTTQDGLALNDVTSIAVTDNGILWVTSEPYGDVQSFNGVKWRNYTVEDGIPNKNVWKVVSVKGGYVWCNSAGGLAYFNGSAWIPYGTADGLPDITLNNIFADDYGNFWITGTRTVPLKSSGPPTTKKIGVFLKYDGEKWTELVNEDAGEYIYGLVIEKNGDIWAGLFNKILHYTGGNWIMYSSENGVKDTIYSLDLDNDGNLWVGTYFNGLGFFDGSTWSYFADGVLPDNIVRSVCASSDGGIWATTREGVVKYNKSTGWQVYRTVNEPPSNWIRAIAFNDSDTWVATDKGLALLQNGIWKNYTTVEGLISNDVRYIKVLDGIVWAATGNGISSYDGTNWINYMEGTEFVTLEVGRDGSLWAGSQSLGIFKFNGTTWVVPSGNITGAEVHSISVGIDGVVWVGIGDKGVYRFDGQSWKNYTSSDGLKDNSVFSVFSCGDGTVWVMTLYGASFFDGVSWVNKAPHITMYGRKVLVDNEGLVWFGTGEGLIRFDGSRYVTTNSEHGLYNYVPEIAIDDNGILWAATDSGVAWILKSDVDFLNPGVQEEKDIPEQFVITGIYPNPFNPSTTISYTTPKPGYVSLAVYNINGQKIRELKSGFVMAGTYNAAWDSRDDSGKQVSSGIYITCLESGNSIVSRKMLLIK